MIHKWLMILATIMMLLILFLLAGLGVVQKPFITLATNGQAIAVAKRSFLGPVLGESLTDVYIVDERIFSMHQDFFAFPDFIYPFADRKRFLCDYWDDTEMLDFVVDLRTSNTNRLSSSEWPIDGELREGLTRGATNMVLETKGIVRLPDYAELREVTDFLNSRNPKTTQAGYFCFFNIGMREVLLLDLATNRHDFFPVAK
jgi:hypothetical protein